MKNFWLFMRKFQCCSASWASYGARDVRQNKFCLTFGTNSMLLSEYLSSRRRLIHRFLLDRLFWTARSGTLKEFFIDKFFKLVEVLLVHFSFLGRKYPSLHISSVENEECSSFPTMKVGITESLLLQENK